MPAVRRRLFNALMLLSLLLCAAVCALWGRSYFIVDGVGTTRASDFVPEVPGQWPPYHATRTFYCVYSNAGRFGPYRFRSTTRDELGCFAYNDQFHGYPRPGRT